jgi:gamma-glutamylcyclotransferase
LSVLSGVVICRCLYDRGNGLCRVCYKVVEQVGWADAGSPTYAVVLIKAPNQIMVGEALPSEGMDMPRPSQPAKFLAMPSFIGLSKPHSHTISCRRRIVKYFSYGSNMSLNRLAFRIKNPEPLGAFYLPMYDLRFHKISKKDKSGKCDSYFTGCNTDVVWGRLYDIAESSKAELDRYEGVGLGYIDKIVTVYDSDESPEQALTYIATNIDVSLKPYTWYKTHVLFGAKEANLPDAYIQKIKLIDAVVDCDTARELNELSVYS